MKVYTDEEIGCPREYEEDGQKKLDPSHDVCHGCKWLNECPDLTAQIIREGLNPPSTRQPCGAAVRRIAGIRCTAASKRR